MHHFLYLTLKFLTLDIIKCTRRCHNFAKTVCNISEKDTSIIREARRTLLFNNGKPYVKNVRNEEL